MTSVLPPLHHAWLAKQSRQALFIPTAMEHQARCVCGFTTAWTTSLQRTDEAMAAHVEENAGKTVELPLSPAAINLRRRLDARAVERASEHINADLRAERLHSNRERVLWGSIVFLIVALAGAAIYLGSK